MLTPRADLFVRSWRSVTELLAIIVSPDSLDEFAKLGLQPFTVRAARTESPGSSLANVVCRCRLHLYASLAQLIDG